MTNPIRFANTWSRETASEAVDSAALRRRVPLTNTAKSRRHEQEHIRRETEANVASRAEDADTAGTRWSHTSCCPTTLAGKGT
jgi:hypothetical protein